MRWGSTPALLIDGPPIPATTASLQKEEPRTQARREKERDMATRLAILLLLGLCLDPKKEAEAATYTDTTPRLWIESKSLSTPWANVALQCLVTNTVAMKFQLLKDGEVVSTLPALAPYAKFPLGPVTADSRGVYRCKIKMSENWSLVSDPVEVTGTEPLPAPSFWAEPGPWILHGLETKLHCQGVLLGMTFDLHKEGEPEPVDSSHAPEPKATFIIKSPGNYTCHYRPPTVAPREASAPSETLHVVRPDSLPKPSLRPLDNVVIRPGGSVTLRCRTKFSGLHFKLFKDGEEVSVPMLSSSDPKTINFHLQDLEPGAGGKYSCRYQFRHGSPIWSEDSESLELVLSTGTLAKPSLSVQPQDAVISRGTNVTLQCQGAHPNMRFALLKQGHLQPVQILSPAGSRADFVLPDAIASDSGNYSCIYFEPVAPFAGSPRSDDVQLHVDGLLPKPKLYPLSAVVTPGKDAVLRCSGRVPASRFHLFREGEHTELNANTQFVDDHTVDFLLKNSKPQDTGLYRCRYHTWTEPRLTSEISDPAEISVTGKLL
ncbi:venom metalloproteinase inhibitor DM43-like isoform X2 [Dromiciops gliroides]|uniref:venom metalloproteinase inhibitor DM43-like isoform X2 n=1 Tax=Dromiciops gliroides TaxID=33562 RepID=UPI001CC698F6|nr:venom metalloproteinase inhibitor DM43-like isoform X2 [Dromiciops gliroides]